MKNKILLAVLAIALVFGMTACKDSGDDSTTGTAPAITTASLPDGEVGTAYSQTLAATGTAPITWSVESGDLPGGLTLSGNTISGMPTAAGAFDFTVKAANAAGNGTKSLSITIAPHIDGIFNTVAEFKTWLDAQSANTRATAYNVKVNISDLSGQYNTSGSLGNALDTNLTKYVNLDLSGSTFTAMPDNASYQGSFEKCGNLTGVTLPASVTSIERSAFFDCTSLASINIYPIALPA